MPLPTVRLALAVALVLGFVLAPDASAAPPKLIRLVSITTSDKNVDVKPLKPSAGDHEDFTSRLLNGRKQFGKPKGALVGSDRGTVTLTTGMVAMMKSVAKLPGGTIIVNGRFRAIGKGAFATVVVGGTGVFAGAHGTLTILAPTNPTTAVNIYRLSYGPVA